MMANDAKDSSAPVDSPDKLTFMEGNGGICLRILYLLIGIAGLACSIACLSSCSFFIWEPSEAPRGVNDTRPDKLLNTSIATVGLTRWEPDYEGCREISDDFDQLSGTYTAAQACAGIAGILGLIALILVIIDVGCCRFPCSRILISIVFLAAFVCQGLTFLVFAAPVCDPNFKNGPFPCSPAEGTWLSIAATVLFLISAVLACCVPKPVPLFVRIRASQKEEATDGCCAICAKKPVEEQGDIEEEKQAESTEKALVEEENGGDVVAGAAVVSKEPVKKTDQPGEEDQEPGTDESTQDEKQLAEGDQTGAAPGDEEKAATDHAAMAEQTKLQTKLQADQTQAAVALDLATVRKNKHDEIERQLELLTKYKDHLSEEEYEERATKLIRALPDPDTFFAYTKTDTIVPVPVVPVEEEEKEEGMGAEEGGETEETEGGEYQDAEQDQDGDGDEEEEDTFPGNEEQKEEGEEKKSMSKKIVGSVGSVGTAVGSVGSKMGSAMKSVGKGVTKPFHKAPVEDAAPVDASSSV